MEDIIDIIVTETTNLIEITSQPTDEIIDVNIIDNREDVTLNVTPTVVEININSLTGNFGVNWGEITGTLSNQTDLQNALNLKADLVDGKVPSSQLPSYVDDVVEVANYASLPVTGEAGKIYVTIDTNFIYRWTGSTYVEIKDSSAVWGAITGTLSSQTDLQNALNAKDSILSFSSPLSRSTNTVSIPAATTSVNGYLTSTDWNTFNSKQAQLNGTGFVKASGTTISYDNSTYLTTSSASSTYVPYTGANASVNLGNNNIEINGTTAYVRVQGGGASGFISESAGAKMQLSSTSLFLTEKQSSPNYTKTLDFRPTILGANYTIVVPDASGTIALTSQLHNAVTIGTANGLTLSTQVLSLGLASSTANGALSSTDWTTFNNKQNALTNPVTGTGTSGIVAVFNGTSSITDSTIYANSARVSIGADVTTTNRFTSVSSTTSAYAIVAQASSAANGIWSNVLGTGEIFRGQTAGGSYFIINNGGNAFLNGNLNVGDFASTSYRLNVVGTANITGALSGTSATFVASGTYTNFLIGTTSTTGAIIVDANRTNLVLGAVTSNKIVFNNASSTQNGYIYSDSAELSLGYPSSGTFNVQKIGVGNVLTIASSGAATFSSSVTSVTSGANSGFNTGALIAKSNGNNFRYTQIGYDNTSNYGWIQALEQGTAYTNLILNGAGGNVGIGTTSPSNPLHIVATTPQIRVSYSSPTDSRYAELSWYGLYGYATSSNNDFNIGIIGGNSGYGNLIFKAGATDTERMRITSSGNVGIGTTSPPVFGSSINLAVNGSGGSLVTLQYNGTTVTRYGANLSTAYILTEGTIPLLFYTNSTERLRILDGGNVIIGSTVDAGNKFQVDGDIYSKGSGALLLTQARNLSNSYGFYGTTATAMNVYSYNYGIVGNFNLTTGVYLATSDRNKKKDFEDSTIGLNEVMQLKPTLYRMKSDNTQGEKELGFIAQDVKGIIPSAYQENSDMIGLNFNPIVAALTKAVQELKAELDTLKNK